MSISDFPRPPEDNGRGVHWTVNVYPPDPASLQSWIGELKSLQIKWLKLLDDSGGSSEPLVRALLDNGIMPVVRLYREHPNPGHLDGRGMVAVRKLVAAGARYFETNNEPDLPAEWEGNRRPANWLDIVVDNFIWDADFILSEGGLPAFPAMGPGNKDNGFERVAQKGRKDLFERGAWVAIHNYTLNHPLDYPNEPVNQSGQPLTEEEYEELKAWQYSHLTQEQAEAHGISGADYFKYQNWAWNGRTMAMVNELRAQSANPGQTIFQDANCFRAFEFFGHQIQAAFGFHVPLISTEGGPVVGWDDDRRYAKVNPTTQAEMQMGIMRFMQDEAPPWYFSCCTWLLASRPLGDFSPTWEQMSWFTHAWNEQFGLRGELPLLQMLRDTPARIRHELRPTLDHGAVEGLAADQNGIPAPGLSLRLRRGDKTIAAGLTGIDGRYRLVAPPGVYDLLVDWVGVVAQDISLEAKDVDVIDLPGLDPAGNFTITAIVRDPTGQPRPGVNVELRRNGVSHASAASDAIGVVSFHPGVAGTYALAAEGGGASVTVDPNQPLASATLTVPAQTGQRYFVTEKRLLPKSESGNDSLFFGRVVDEANRGLKNIDMEMRWVNAAPGTTFPRTRTGQNPFKPDPDGYYEFFHSQGEFLVQVVEGDSPSEVADGLVTTGIPGREGDPVSYEINFQLRPLPVQTEAKSTVAGSIAGGRVGQTVRLWNAQQHRDLALDDTRQFRFDELPAGVYDLELAGVGVIRPDLTLDGSNQVTIDFPLEGAIIGEIENPDPNQRRVSLIAETYGFTRHAELTPENRYRFTNLPAGAYRVEIGDAMLAGLVSDGLTLLQAPVLRAGAAPFVPGPTNSSIRGSICDLSGEPLAALLLNLQRGGQGVSIATSSSDGSFTFSGLGAGVYDLFGVGQALAAGLALDGRNALELALTLDIEAPVGKPLARYYLLGAADADLAPAFIRLVAPWLASQPDGVAGFSLNEALHAESVVVIGDGIDDAAVAALQSAGVQIVDIRRDLLALAQLLAPPSDYPPLPAPPADAEQGALP